tara:strand:+ start:6843 stop:7688 length:846 start_codon:yes stop_codon:yes gene_type:complete
MSCIQTDPLYLGQYNKYWNYIKNNDNLIVNQTVYVCSDECYSEFINNNKHKCNCFIWIIHAMYKDLYKLQILYTNTHGQISNIISHTIHRKSCHLHINTTEIYNIMEEKFIQFYKYVSKPHKYIKNMDEFNDFMDEFIDFTVDREYTIKYFEKYNDYHEFIENNLTYSNTYHIIILDSKDEEKKEIYVRFYINNKKYTEKTYDYLEYISKKMIRKIYYKNPALCNHCKQLFSTFQCTQCKTYYCSRICQKNDWKYHKKYCIQFSNSRCNTRYNSRCTSEST